jgi:hypothetical protein
MANANTTGFGFRPIKMVGQSYNNAGLSEWNVAASSALICHSALTILTADGVMFEVMSADTAFNANEVGGCADQVTANGGSPLFNSLSKISATTAATKAQLKIIGVSRDPDHSDTTEEGFALRVMINEHILGNNVDGI